MLTWVIIKTILYVEGSMNGIYIRGLCISSIVQNKVYSWNIAVHVKVGVITSNL